jgi:hypothetical protein
VGPLSTPGAVHVKDTVTFSGASGEVIILPSQTMTTSLARTDVGGMA